MRFERILSKKNVLMIPFFKFQIDIAHKVYIFPRNVWHQMIAETPAFRINNKKKIA